MEKLPDDMKKITSEFLKDIQETFGESLLSVILYGAAVRGEKSKEPYITYMVIVKDNTPSELARCTKYVKQWYRKLITIPHFLRPDYITQSLDTFPLEFMDISSSYHVVYGEDVLANLAYEASDVRNECERELKGKLLHLRAEYLNLHGDTKGLIDLVNRSLNTFRLLFSGALYLKKRVIPQKTEALLDTVTEEYDLNAVFFKKLIAVGKGEIKVDNNEADRLFDQYVEELDKLSKEIDTLSLMEET